MYQVTKPYFDGDHDHGTYSSPYFETLEEAEAFKKAVWNDAYDRNKWWTTTWEEDMEEPLISEIKCSKFVAEEVRRARSYLELTYT